GRGRRVGRLWGGGSFRRQDLGRSARRGGRRHRRDAGEERLPRAHHPRRPARRGEPRRAAHAFHAGDHHRRAAARGGPVRPAGGRGRQGAGQALSRRPRLMNRPAELEQAIARELASIDARELATAARRLSERYARGEFATALADPADRAAYLAVRFPATYAASAKVLDHVRARLPDARYVSLL